MMRKISIYFNYKHTDEPWGGANNFNRLLYNKMSEKSDFIIEERITKNTDIIFLNGLSNGASIEKNQGKVSYRQFKKFKLSGAKIVIRAINLKQHAHQHNPYHAWLDYWTVRIFNEADYVIFQSEYQRTVFLGAGFKNTQNSVILNGADSTIFRFSKREINNKKIKLVSAISGIKKSKNIDLLVNISKCKDIEVYHIGQWDHNIDKQNINLLGMKQHEEMAIIYSQMDAFIFTGMHDMCPNVLFEALLSGLPVVYYPYQSSNHEIVKDHGLPLSTEDYKKTFDDLRKNYQKIVNLIERHINFYSIERTMSEYIKIFKKVVNDE